MAEYSRNLQANSEEKTSAWRLFKRQVANHNCAVSIPYFRIGMPKTLYQRHGELAEKAVTQHCTCPRCKKPSARLRPLGVGFTGADVICSFCGYLAQVKGTSKKGKTTIVRGSGWKAQEERLDAGIYFPIFIVKLQDERPISIHYIPADFLRREFFVKGRRRRIIRSGQPAGKPRRYWMFNYDLRKLDPSRIVQVWPEELPTNTIDR